MSVVLKAEKREKLGSLATKKIRKEGRIPAVIYSKNGNIHLSLDVKEFEQEYFKGIALTSVIELELGGKKTKVIAHKVEVDPVSDHPTHVDFLNCEENKEIRAKPKLVFINQERSPGLKKGGFLHVVLRRVEVVCDNIKAIPEKIEIDAGSLHVSSKVRASNLVLPTGVKLAKKGNFLIASIIGRGKSDDDAKSAAAQAAATAGAAPAKAEEKKADKK